LDKTEMLGGGRLDVPQPLSIDPVDWGADGTVEGPADGLGTRRRRVLALSLKVLVLSAQAVLTVCSYMRCNRACAMGFGVSQWVAT
jgi:hypothetical protein